MGAAFLGGLRFAGDGMLPSGARPVCASNVAFPVVDGQAARADAIGGARRWCPGVVALGGLGVVPVVYLFPELIDLQVETARRVVKSLALREPRVKLFAQVKEVLFDWADALFRCRHGLRLRGRRAAGRDGFRSLGGA
jgi:hypothetical protein